jgi:hypothetical protein
VLVDGAGGSTVGLEAEFLRLKMPFKSNKRPTINKMQMSNRVDLLIIFFCKLQISIIT